MEGELKMSENLKNIFHIGGQSLSEINELIKDFKYHHLEVKATLKEELSRLRSITNNEINNSNDLFLLSKEVMYHLQDIDLIKLPSHQIFYETLEGASEVEIRILTLKGAQQTELSDKGVDFFHYINRNYIKPWGLSLNNSMVDINSNFEGIVTKKGSSKYILEGNFGLDYQQVLLWKNKWAAWGNINFYPEISQTENLSYYWRAYFKSSNSTSQINYRDFYPEQLNAGQVYFDIGYSEFPINFGLFIKGNGKIEVGDLHIRYGLSKGNFLAMGGERLIQKDNMGEELGVYFNAGDLKPPLNVYFSGFRPSEGYEGRWMMGSLGAPFILVHDPRIVGGSFYRGERLEEELIEYIQSKLKVLGFSKQDLILSGLSMGTYASFYYGAKLEPHAIVVGKPLANIGGLAVNSRIFAPYGWDLAMDTIINLTGELTKESADSLDEDFWSKFESANFSKTTFLIAHMLHDTDRPFKQIFNYLKINYPTAKVLHKGLEGRHNDNSRGITSWFYRQYQQLLISDFDRYLIIDDDEKEEIDLRGEDND